MFLVQIHVPQKESVVPMLNAPVTITRPSVAAPMGSRVIRRRNRVVCVFRSHVAVETSAREVRCVLSTCVNSLVVRPLSVPKESGVTRACAYKSATRTATA